MPGARRVWMVTMKFSPVRIEEKPETNTAVMSATTWPLANMLESGV